MALLRIRNGKQEGVEIDLEIGENLVGRGPDARIYLDDPTVSLKHAVLWAKVQWFVRDLEADNLTLLNNAEVEPGTDEEVQHGDKLSFGGVEATLDVEAAASSIDEAAAALDKAQSTITSMRAEIAGLKMSLKQHEAAVKTRDAALIEAQGALRELARNLDPNMYLTREQFDAERSKIEAAVQADAKRQIDAMNRRNTELEQKYVKLMTENETLQRKLREAGVKP